MAPLAACLLVASLTYLSGAAEIYPRYADKDLLYGNFPKGFLWGSATASYQVEGGFNASGRTFSIWDVFARQPGKIKDGSNGDIACDSFNKYEEDIRIMKNMSVKHYRFSISWSRVLADGTNATYLPQGMAYYKNLVKALRANDIEPLVTMYHWDLPQALQVRGGWLNDSIVGLFEEYARVCFRELGDQVKWWLTFNEPIEFCNQGYNLGTHAPGRNDPGGVDVYKCAHNVIRAHARAYRLYNETFRATQAGKVSITLDIQYKEPDNSSSPDDQAAALRALQFTGGWFAHPIYKNGDYPDVMKAVIANRSALQGLNSSRLPAFTEEEKLLNMGTYDYFGLNHYTTQLTKAGQFNISDRTYEADVGVSTRADPQWVRANSSWLYVVPWGMRKILQFVRDEYNNPDVVITENGMSYNGGSPDAILNDQPRADYYRDYINNVLKAIVEDNCSVIGYTAWSLMDNFEWAEGYTERFGLHYVDFNDPDRKRIPKKSVAYLAQLFRDNGFINPNSTTTAAVTTTATAAVTTTATAAVTTTTTAAVTTTATAAVTTTATIAVTTTLSSNPSTASNAGGPAAPVCHALWRTAAAAAAAAAVACRFGRFRFTLP